MPGRKPRLSLAGALERVKTSVSRGVTATRQWQREARETALARVQRTLRNNQRGHVSRLDRVEPEESARGDRRVRPGSTETHEFWKR
jgi:hypothetical protein